MGDLADSTRLLVVEDNPNNLKLMVRILEANAFEVFTAEDGEAGVAAAIRIRPMLILMDLQMPRLDGFGALEALRKEEITRDIPVIAVSGNATTADRSRAMAAGFRTFVAKPFRIDRLLAEIRIHL